MEILILLTYRSRIFLVSARQVGVESHQDWTPLTDLTQARYQRSDTVAVQNVSLIC